MRATKQGVITKKIDSKTAAVETFNMKTHPIYKKRFKVMKKYLAHDPEGKFAAGDVVRIRERRPISKKKTFEIIEKIGSTIVSEEKIRGEEVLGAEKVVEEKADDKKENESGEKDS